MEGHAIIYFPSSFRVFVLDEVLHTCARGLGFCSTDGVLYDVVLGQIMLLRIVIESEVGVASANRNSHPFTSVASTKMSDQFAALTNPTGSVATPNVASSAASKASNRLRVDIGKANSPDATNLFGLIICLPRDNFPGDLQRFAPGTMIKLPCRSMTRNSALTDPDVVDPALPSGDAVRVAASRTVRAFVQFAEMVDVGEGFTRGESGALSTRGDQDPEPPWHRRNLACRSHTCCPQRDTTPCMSKGRRLSAVCPSTSPIRRRSQIGYPLHSRYTKPAFGRQSVRIRA